MTRKATRAGAPKARPRTVTLLYSGNALVVSPTTDDVYNRLAPALTYQSREYDAARARQGMRPYEFTDVQCFTLDFRDRISTCFGYLERVMMALEEGGYDVRLKEVPFVRSSPPHPDAYKPRFDMLLEWARLKYRQDEMLLKIASYPNGQLHAPPGFGKSFMVLCACATFPKARILVAADPVAVVKDVLYAELAGGIPDIGIVGGGKRIMGRRVMCSTFDSLHHIDPDWPDIVLVDECFPAGTLVDGRPIETFRVGDVVTAYNEYDGRLVARKVARVYRRELVGNLVEIGAGDRRVVATEEHPFYTERGWVNAKDLTTADRLLLRVRPPVRADEGSEVEAVQGPAGLLLDGLSSAGVRTRRAGEHHVAGEPSGGIEAHEAGQPVEAGDGTVEDLGDPAQDRPSAGRSTRQRFRHDGLRASPGRCGRPEAGRHLDRSSAERSADELQDRPGRRVGQAGGRDRRRQPLPAGEAGGGPSQGGVLTWVGVDRITVHEHAGTDGPGGLCPDGHVYNLEVEGEHTYLANDVVVHNCHQAAAEEASSRLVRFCHARMYGLSATTQMRPDGSDLVTEGLFGPVRFYMSYQEAQDHGLVGEIEIRWRSVRSVHNPCEGVRNSVERERRGIWQHKLRNRLIVEDARAALAEGEPVLVTCRVVEHLAHLKALCPEAILIHAEDDRSTRSAMHDWEGSLIPTQEPMTTERRDRLTQRLKNGEPGIYVITPILNIGFNAKHLRYLVRADGAGSAIQDTQVPGRVSRSNEVKSGGIVIDYLDEFDPRGFGKKAGWRRDNYAFHGWKQVFPGNGSGPPRRRRRSELGPRV